MHQSSIAASSSVGNEARFVAWLRRFSLNDWTALAYLLFLCCMLLLAPPSPERTASTSRVLWLLFGFSSAVVATRTSLLKPAWLGAFVYRVGHFATLQLSYLALADLLPAVNPAALDEQLFELDMVLFGVEPAFLMDRFVSPTTTEWFAFFYYSYFLIIAAHIFTILFFGKHHRVVAEFALGMTLIVCLGQAIYTLVPGFGPYKAFPGWFTNELPSGVWWALVTDIVSNGGAQKDIFPSLHTALPTFILLFSFHNRALAPYRYTWPVLAFFALNIIIATMFLRWHYLIDVVAGLALSVGAFYASIWLVKWETAFRRRHRCGKVWPDYVS